MGGYPDLNRELTVPHTVVLPIELHPPFITSLLFFLLDLLLVRYFVVSLYNYAIMLEWFEHSIVNTKNLWLTD